MKKIYLIILSAMAAICSHAQSLESVKNLLVLQKYDEAKTEFEKMNVQSQVPEYYLLKAAIYSALLNDGKPEDQPATEAFTAGAETAFKRYRQMEPGMPLLSQVVYQTCPIDLYTVFYNAAYKDYAAKNWDAAYGKIKKAAEYSDLLIQKKLLAATLDTNLVILAAIISENNGVKEDAARYYARLADSRISGDGFESVYRYLVSYYFQKENIAAFEKYKTTGAVLYPASEYFKYDQVDFAVGLAENFAAKQKALERILATDAANFKANEVLGELIYDELNPADSTKKIPENAAQLEKQMIAAFNRSSAAKPGYEIPFIYMGDHFINKAAGISNARMQVLADAARADALELEYAAALFAAQGPYEKAAAIFAKKTSLASKDKVQYKKVAGYLSNIAQYKKVKAKAGSAEQNKWMAEEGKWTLLAGSIK